MHAAWHLNCTVFASWKGILSVLLTYSLFSGSFLHIISYCSQVKNPWFFVVYLLSSQILSLSSNVLFWIFTTTSFTLLLQNLFGPLLTYPRGSLCSTTLISHFWLFTTITCTQLLRTESEETLHMYITCLQYILNIKSFMCVYSHDSLSSQRNPIALLFGFTVIFTAFYKTQNPHSVLSQQKNNLEIHILNWNIFVLFSIL